MSRQNRIAFLVAALLVVAVTGTVFATRQIPSTGGPAAPAASGGLQADDGPPDAEAVAHAAARLSEAEIAFDEAQLADLAARYGIGGAVRLIAWADEKGMDVEDIAKMRDGDGTPESVMGWGQIAHELDVHVGLGSIMGGGGGGGRDSAPGQQGGGDDDSGG